MIQDKLLKGEKLTEAEESIRKQIAVSVGQWLQQTLAGAPQYVKDEVYKETNKRLGIDFQAKAGVNYDILTALQHKMIQQSTLEGMVKSPIESIIKTTADVTKLYEQFQEQWREDVATIKANEDILKKRV